MEFIPRPDQQESFTLPPSSPSNAEQGRAERPSSAPKPSAPDQLTGQLINRFFWLVVTMALVLAAWFVGPTLVEKYQNAATRGRVSAEYAHAVEALKQQPLTNVSLAFELVAQKIRPSVVSIQFGNYSQLGQGRVPSGFGQGSGVIMSKEGYVLTNHHVVKDAEFIQVVLFDRRRFSAEVIGSDLLTDLAILKIDAGVS